MAVESRVLWGNEMPRREDCVEIVSLVTHGSYQRADLVMSLLSYVGRLTVQSGRTSLILCDSASDEGILRKIGLVAAQVKVREATLNTDVENGIFVASTTSLMTGRRSAPLYWNAVWGDVSKDLILSGSMDANRLDRLRARLFGFMKFASLSLMWRRKRPRRLR